MTDSLPSQTAAPGPESPADRSPRPAASGARLWLWVGAIFLFMALLWAAMFTAAREAHIESVPLTTKGGGN